MNGDWFFSWIINCFSCEKLQDFGCWYDLDLHIQFDLTGAVTAGSFISHI